MVTVSTLNIILYSIIKYQGSFLYNVVLLTKVVQTVFLNIKCVYICLFISYGIMESEGT